MLEIKTDKNWWDCECPENYQHKKTEETFCPICGAQEKDQPDSIAEEVLANASIKK